jgi:hypothetical protein
MTRGIGMKRVLVTLDKTPNYVFHMAALAGAGFTSPYAERYRDTIPPEDLDTLVKHKDRIKFGFGDGDGGDLAGAVLFEPAHLALESSREMSEYFHLLSHALETGEYQEFLDRYRYAHPEPPDWNVHVDEEWMAGLAPSHSAIRELGDVFARNFDDYDRKVYPLEAVRMTGTALKLNARFKEWDCIAKWEEVTGFTWKYPDYQIALCSALENGPTANSIGYRKNSFYFGHDFEWTWRFISHEVGTHIMMDVMIDPAERESPLTEYDPYLVYRAYENLARFYNCKVLGEDNPYDMSPQYHHEEFNAIFARIDGSHAGLGPEDLLVEGLSQYVSEHPEVV